MLRSKRIWAGPLGAGLIVLTGGCTKPAVTVYVDIPSLLVEAPTVKTELPPIPPGGVPSRTMTLPSLPPRSLRDESKGQIDAAKIALEEDRKAAYRTLVARFSQEAQDRISREEEVRLLGLEAEHMAIDVAIEIRIRQAFEAYANQRGPLVIQVEKLAALRGTTAKLRAETAENIRLTRAKIQQLDQQYREAIQGLMSDRQRQYDSLVTAIKVQTSRDIAVALTDAEERAKRAVGRAEERVDGKTLAGLDRVLPGAPSRTATLSPIAGPGAAPIPKFEAPLSSKEDRLRLLKERADIWARTSGYRLSSNPKEGKDATSEFLLWMNQRKSGL